MQSATNEKALVHVVDDDASMRGALEGLFDSVGLQTQTYATAKDFLSANLSDRPGCIVLDVRLPDMNGLEFQGRLTQIGVGIPVVMMTGFGDIPMSVGGCHKEARRWSFPRKAVSRPGYARCRHGCHRARPTTTGRRE